MNFSIVIPTYNREEDLSKCINSIILQSKKPSEIIIIDDGNLNNNFIVLNIKKCLDNKIFLRYYKKDHKLERRGLSESKNKSLDLISNNIFFIFDDDVVLKNDFCEHIVKLWEKENTKNIIGIGGLIKNRRKRYFFEKFYYKFFGIYSKYDWDVNRLGFQIWNEEIKKKSIGYYAHGGVCSYNLNKVKEIRFSTFSGGRTALEDVDFCLRAKNKGYKFIIEPKSQLYHYPSNSSRESLFLMGYKESCNRKAIFKTQNNKACMSLWVWFFWANFGWILRQFLVGNFSKGRGLLKGLFDK